MMRWWSTGLRFGALAAHSKLRTAPGLRRLYAVPVVGDRVFPGARPWSAPWRWSIAGLMLDEVAISSPASPRRLCDRRARLFHHLPRHREARYMAVGHGIAAIVGPLGARTVKARGQASRRSARAWPTRSTWAAFDADGERHAADDLPAPAYSSTARPARAMSAGDGRPRRRCASTMPTAGCSPNGPMPNRGALPRPTACCGSGAAAARLLARLESAMPRSPRQSTRATTYVDRTGALAAASAGEE